jgi:SsrA-binding protein
MAREEKTITANKKAFHDYFVDERFETGIALTGTEVKSLRENGASLRDTFATIRKGEVWLLHRKEIRYLIGKTKEKGYALIPIRLYFTEANLVKVELGLARGKKLYDKRDAVAEKDAKRDADRALRERQKDR